MIKQCVLQADKTIRDAKTQVLSPGGRPLYRLLALLVAGLQPLLFIILPVNTISDESGLQHENILSCYGSPYSNASSASGAELGQPSADQPTKHTRSGLYDRTTKSHAR